MTNTTRERSTESESGDEELVIDGNGNVNQVLLRRFYDEIFNQGHLDVAGELIASDFVDHIPRPMPGQPSEGAAAVTWLASLLRTAFPDLHVSLDEVLEVGDRLVARVTWSGRQTGQLLGADPTGKRIKVAGIDIIRFSDGKIVEHWGQMDVLGMLGQLGFLPRW